MVIKIKIRTTNKVCFNQVVAVDNNNDNNNMLFLYKA